jgi:hypothetical protein
VDVANPMSEKSLLIGKTNANAIRMCRMLLI